MANVMLGLEMFLFDMNPDVLALKVNDFKFWIGVLLVVDFPTQVLLTILLFTDHSWCK